MPFSLLANLYFVHSQEGGRPKCVVARRQGPSETASEAPGAAVMGLKEEPKEWPWESAEELRKD